MSFHVIPRHDDREHVRHMSCWCDPLVEWTDPRTGDIWPEALVSHNAADGRELMEKATGGSYGGWLLYESDESL